MLCRCLQPGPGCLDKWTSVREWIWRWEAQSSFCKGRAKAHTITPQRSGWERAGPGMWLYQCNIAYILSLWHIIRNRVLLSTLNVIFLSKQRREVRKQEQANNPFYIKASPSSQKVGIKFTNMLVVLSHQSMWSCHMDIYLRHLTHKSYGQLALLLCFVVCS